ncbi:MAG TPA: AraC family transcriptional regulator [Spirochaetota bacterium]|nr:AraC family transcriptional regulator [Spirochaetota bacterium]HPI88556.1 AraC family transcriptional regulator [Spirochaetota bacterium]HPR48197.1 AraC family transcriptional regulator [Spirochaetota bacterium]
MDLFTVCVFSGICIAGLIVLSIAVRPWCFRSRVVAMLIVLQGYLLFFLYLMATQKIFHWPWLFFTQMPASLLLGPLSYVYIQIVLDDKKGLDRQDWLHFIPFAASALVLFPVFNSGSGRMREIIYNTVVKADNLPLRMALVAVIGAIALYLGILIKNVWKRGRIENRAQNLLLVFNGFLFLGPAIFMAGIAGIIIYSSGLLKFSCIMIVCIMLFMYVIMQRFPYLVFFGTVPGFGETARRQIMGTEEVAVMDRQLKLLMEDERFYADEDLTLTRLSSALEVTPHALSRFLNEQHSLNFTGYVNRYRVREAERMLIEKPAMNTMSVAYSSGFGTYSAFYSAFKKETGMTPAEYRLKKKREGPA